jgi:toxin ParE1/3/4
MGRKPRVLRTRRARQDLIDIWRHIGNDDPAAADRLLDRIDARCALLADHPQLGPERTDIRPGLHYLVVERYLILYRTIAEGIEIVRVVHGARDLPNLF